MTLPTMTRTTYAAPVNAAHLSTILTACSLHVAASVAACYERWPFGRPAVMGALSRRFPRLAPAAAGHGTSGCKLICRPTANAARAVGVPGVPPPRRWRRDVRRLRLRGLRRI